MAQEELGFSLLDSCFIQLQIHRVQDKTMFYFLIPMFNLYYWFIIYILLKNVTILKLIKIYP